MPDFAYNTVKARDIEPGNHLVAPVGAVTDASWVGPRITAVTPGIGDTVQIRTINGGQVTFPSYEAVAVVASWDHPLGQLVNAIELPHVHEWGPIETARFTGNPHRKCTDSGCSDISLDLDD